MAFLQLTIYATNYIRIFLYIQLNVHHVTSIQQFNLTVRPTNLQPLAPLTLVQNILILFSFFNDFDILHTKKTPEPAPLQKLESRRPNVYIMFIY